MQRYIDILDDYVFDIEDNPHEYLYANRLIFQLERFSYRLKEELIYSDEAKEQRLLADRLRIENKAFQATAKAELERMRVYHREIRRRENEERIKQDAMIMHEKKQARLEQLQKNAIEKQELDAQAALYRIKKLLENTGIL